MSITRNGVTFTEAYLEASAAAPINRAMLNTFDLYHPLVGHIYFVADQTNLFANLEADAGNSRGGDQIEFLACPLRVKPPEESDTADTPDIILQVDNLSGLVSDALRLTRGSLVPWMIANRIYASDDLSGPAQLPPYVVEIVNAAIDETTVELTCNFGDAGNLGVPALTFNRIDYPGLVR